MAVRRIFITAETLRESKIGHQGHQGQAEDELKRGEKEENRCKN